MSCSVTTRPVVIDRGVPSMRHDPVDQHQRLVREPDPGRVVVDAREVGPEDVADPADGEFQALASIERRGRSLVGVGWVELSGPHRVGGGSFREPEMADRPRPERAAPEAVAPSGRPSDRRGPGRSRSKPGGTPRGHPRGRTRSAKTCRIKGFDSIDELTGSGSHIGRLMGVRSCYRRPPLPNPLPQGGRGSNQVDSGPLPPRRGRVGERGISGSDHQISRRAPGARTAGHRPRPGSSCPVGFVLVEPASPQASVKPAAGRPGTARRSGGRGPTDGGHRLAVGRAGGKRLGGARPLEDLADHPGAGAAGADLDEGADPVVVSPRTTSGKSTPLEGVGQDRVGGRLASRPA